MAERTLRQRVDLAAIVGQFLTTVRLQDLVVELIQNELDARSTFTSIEFGENALVCEGNGRPVDAKGWSRFDVILGAGGEVEAKVDGFGSKNHGLRTGFLLGDNVLIQSAGQRLELTLCGDPLKRRLNPGTYSMELDPNAPKNGTRVTIPYRTQSLDVPSGERFQLEPIARETVEKLYAQACDAAPDRFVGAVSAHRDGRYLLKLSFEGSAVTFEFRAIKLKPSALQKRTVRRGCNDGPTTIVYREVASRFELTLPENDVSKVPGFFQRGRSIFGELAWSSDESDGPLACVGKLRYPISYPSGANDGYSGHGFHISGPFLSDTARHGATESIRNDNIVAQARIAFAKLLRKSLIPTHGPHTLALTRRVDRPDLEAERTLALELLREGALAIEGARRRKHNVVNMREGWRVTAATFKSQPSVIANDLLQLAPEYEQLLSLGTPDYVVHAIFEAIRAFPQLSNRIGYFTEAEAIAEITPIDAATRSARLAEQTTPSRLLRTAQILKIAQGLIDRNTLQPDLRRALVERLIVPTTANREAARASVLYSRDPIPAIDGVTPPLIIHPKLVQLRLLREGPAKLARFKIDEYLKRLDFSKAGAGSRTAFFKWLATNHARLEPQTLAVLGNQPFWPTTAGTHVSLDSFCVPRTAQIAQLLAEANPQPTEDVRRFPGLRKTGRGALRIRQEPTEAELKAWYQHRLMELQTTEGSTSEGFRVKLDDLESDLWVLFRERALTEIVRRTAIDHETLTKIGTLKRTSELHLPTAAILAVKLADECLIAGRGDDLYLALGARTTPSAEATLQALRSDPRADLLFKRLDAYIGAGGSPAALLNEVIIPVGDTVLRPVDLKLSAAVDHWGEWKRAWDPPNLNPERAHLLIECGVTPRSISRDSSQAFFAWLSNQPIHVQRIHLDQVMRHWRDRQRGPSEWWQTCRNLPCLPVQRKEPAFSLVSFAQATSDRATVYLPDFPGVQEQLLQQDGRRALAVVEVRSVQGSILNLLRQAKIRSLREHAGQPIRLTTVGEARSGDQDLNHVLLRMKSESLLSSLPKRLEAFELTEERMIPRWRSLIRQLDGVRLVKSLQATYEVGGKHYTIVTNAGIKDGIVWLAASSDPLRHFYEALAQHLFVGGGPALAPYGLRLAVEESYESVEVPIPPALDEDERDAPPSGAPRLGGLHRGHGLSPSDMAPHAPAPTPFARNDTSTRRREAARPPRSSKPGFPRSSATEPLRNSVEEAEEIRKIKEENYVWHCQACLGQYDVERVVPSRSYLSVNRYRHSNVEAHHVDHLQNVGSAAIGARNILLLCKFHHDFLGDRLSRETVTAALRTAQPVERRFPTDAAYAHFHVQAGILATVEIDVEPFQVSLFFTPEHAKAWGFDAETKGGEAKSSASTGESVSLPPNVGESHFQITEEN